MIMSILEFMFRILNVSVVRQFPRHSVRFAKKIFGGKKIIAIEIGTFQGYHAENILKELNIEKLYLVDPYEEYIQEGTLGKTKGSLSKAERFARNKLKRFGDRIFWVKKYSDDAVKDFKEKVDFIYIDGNHDYKFVKEDMENYFKILKKGGVMGGHDITGGFGVEQALVEFCYENKLVPRISRTDWWVVKK